MSFTQIAIAAGALALLAPSASEACMQNFLTKRHLAVMGAVAAVTFPLWIVPAAGYGIVVGISSAASSAKEKMHSDFAQTTLAERDAEYWRRRTDEIRPFFEEAEKNPNPVNIFRLGMHLIAAEDFVTGRRFLRRSIDLAKQQNPQGWDKDVNLLPILALATQQIGELLMRLHSFSDAYDQFVEAARLAANLNAFSAEDKKQAIAASSSSNAANPNAATENFNLLSETDLQHSIAWACLHKALYALDEQDPQVDGLLQSAVNALDKLRGAFAEYDLHYAIGRFYQFARTMRRDRPSAEDDGDDDPSATNWNHTYYTQTIPAFKAEFTAKIAPLFDGVIKRLKADGLADVSCTDDPASKGLWGTANLYQARCFFVLDDLHSADQCMTIARKMFVTRNNSDEGETELFGMNVKEIRDCVGRGEEDRESEFNRIDRALELHVLESPGKNWKCGTQPHEWIQRKFHRPSTCQACMKMISWSENRAGPFECNACHYRCHKECKEKLGADSVCGAASDISKLGDHQHILRKRTLHSPHFCGLCDSVIKNFFAAYGCESCAVLVHEDCAKKMRNALIALK